MGKDYKRKTDRGSYGEEDLKRALLSSRTDSHTTLLKNLLKFRDELYRDTRPIGQVLQLGRPFLGRFRVTLNEEFENELYIVAHAIGLQQRFYGMTPTDLRA